MDWWLWVALGVICLIAEIFTLGFFLFFLGLGALVVALMVAVDPALPTWAQLLIYSVLSVSFLWAFRERAQRMMLGPHRPTPDSLVGATLTVVESIPPQGMSRAELRGSSWGVKNVGRGEISKDAIARVIAMDGLTLQIKGEGEP